MIRSGMSTLISAGTGADDKDPDTVVISVSAPYSVGLPAKEMYKDEKVLKKYEETASEVFSALQSYGTLQAVDVHDLVAFEQKVAAATPDAEDRNDVTVSCVQHFIILELTLLRNTTTLCRYPKPLI